MKSRAREFAFNSLVLLCSFSLIIAASEAVFRHQQWAAFEAAASTWHHPLYQLLPDNPREFALIPASAGTGVVRSTGIEWDYRINSRGFRSDETSPATIASRRNVVFLGDSYLFGFAVNQQDTFTESIKATMRAAGQEPPNLHNLGVPGYNTMHELALLREQFASYQADLVVLGFVPNDAEPQANVLRRPDVLYRHQPLWILSQLKHAVNHYVFADREVLATGLNQMSLSFNEAYTTRNSKYADTRQAFDRIAAFCRESRVPLLVVIFPAFAARFDDAYEYARIHREVLQWSAENRVRAIDLFPAFRGRTAQDYAVPGDGHPNAAAHRHAAGVVTPVILEMLATPGNNAREP